MELEGERRELVSGERCHRYKERDKKRVRRRELEGERRELEGERRELVSGVEIRIGKN